MRPTVIASTIRALFNAGVMRPLYISGPPGTAKTSVPMQVADDLGIGFCCIHVPSQPVDDFGVPFPSADKTRLSYLLNDRFPLEGSDWPDTGILVADELAQADAHAQKGWANIIQSREIHGRKLKAGWLIVGTGNRAQDRAGATRLLSHLADRMTEIEMDYSITDWAQWAQRNGVHDMVIGYAKFDHEFYSFDPKRDKNSTFRGWTEGVSPIIGVVPQEAEYDMIKGIVGEAQAAKFTGFLRMYRKLPHPDTVLADPHNAPIPDEASVKYAICAALSKRVTVANWPAVCTYVRRMPKEYSTSAILDCIANEPAVQQTREYIDWVQTDGKAVLF